MPARTGSAPARARLMRETQVLGWIFVAGSAYHLILAMRQETSMPQLATALIRKIPGVDRLIAKIQGIEHRLKMLESWTATGRLRADGPDSFPLQDWWTRSFWEPTVALAIRDHCRPGDVVFDVGCNAGGLALMMSRLVGPRGIVLAFEASPRIVDKTHYNLVKAGCHNVTLFHKAVWHSTGALVNMAAGSHLNDRIEEGATGMSVRTVALDDLAATGDFRPSFIKMDIEGAEPRCAARHAPAAGRGAPGAGAGTIAGRHALPCAADRGGLSGGGPVHLSADHPRGGFRSRRGRGQRAVCAARAGGREPHFSEAEPEEVAVLPGDRFMRAANGDISLTAPLDLPAGRYLVRADFTAEGTDNAVFAGVEADGEVIFRYHTFTRFMAESYADWVIQLDRPARVAPYVRFLEGADPTLRWNGVTVLRLPGFDGLGRAGGGVAGGRWCRARCCVGRELQPVGASVSSGRSLFR